MKYQEHYLATKTTKKFCPLKDGGICDSYCAWFDHEEQDCRMIGGFWKIVEAIRDGYDPKREFKF